MIASDALSPAYTALDECDALLSKLDAGCCEPGRSPRMQHLASTLALARTSLAGFARDPSTSDQTIAALEDAGAQIGALQIGCCAPKRLPLYADMLERLTTVQLTISKALGTDHLG